MAAHAKLSASGAHRWINCPGSVKAEDGIKDTTSPHAEEGTAAHELAELVLTNGGSCHDWLDCPLVENNQYTVTQEMADNVQQYVDYVTATPGMQQYELRVSYTDWVPEGFGTADAISVDAASKTLYCIDLKYGKGVKVDADNNPQGMLYGLGAFSQVEGIYEVEQVTIAIVQPRLDHISEWTISIDDLLRWGAWVSERAQMALEPNAERVPGETQCRFCKAKATCPALYDYTTRIIASDFDNLDSPEHLTDERMAEVMGAKKLITGWLDAVEEHITERLKTGDDFPGYKLVEGRSNRQWADEVEAEIEIRSKLGEDAYERKLLTPAKAEKALGKTKAKEIQGLITKPEGKPVLAHESDNRKPIGVTPDDFDD